MSFITSHDDSGGKEDQIKMDVQRWFDTLKNWLNSLLAKEIFPVERKVTVITYAPRIPSLGNLPLYQAMPGWQDPNRLIDQLVSDMAEASHGYANFVIAENILVEEFTPMMGGQSYSPDLFLSAYTNKQPQLEDRADYAAILARFDIIEKIRTKQIDEVWLMGYPFAGFNESRMGGPRAFFCNGESLPGCHLAARRFLVMGFNYERGIGEMLESMAHRAEFILEHLYSGKTGAANLYERFTRIDWKSPGQAEVGTVHHGPNAILTPDRDDHQWTESRYVLSRHHTWANFPDLTGEAQPTNCDAWRDSDMTRGHHLWWFKYFPHTTGQTNAISNNWWQAVIDPETIWR